MPNDPDEHAQEKYDRPSKSHVKREMLSLLELGKQLVELPPEKLKQLKLAENLFDAVRQAQRITSREGRRRQIHYVGKLMRNAPADEIRAQIEVWENGSRENTLAMHRLEKLRDLLLEDDSALAKLFEEYPHMDLQSMRTLLRAARNEAKHNATLKAGQDARRKHYRALFHVLKELDTTPEQQ